METRVLAKAFLQNGQDILLLRRSESDERRPLQWDIPGGTVEPGEEFAVACAREIAEEVGLQVAAKDLLLIFTECVFVPEKNLNVIWLYFYAPVSSREVTLSFEHDEVWWTRVEDALEQAEYERLRNALIHLQETQLTQTSA